MSKPTKLYKTTIVIWSDYQTDEVEADELVRDSIYWDSFYSGKECVEVTDPGQFPDTEFFDTEQ